MGETATFSVRYRPETRTACTFLVICLVLMPSWLPASTDEYVAFSLGNAQERIETLGESEWRQAAPDVFQIGGITRICGLICDQTANDVVLVGQRDAARTTLTLDDLVVALRARLVRGEWPEVSIDPRGDVGTCLVQDVHFKGGLEDTAFGYSLFEADYLLKRLALNLEAIGVKGIRTQYDLAIAQLRARAGHPTQVTCRYWFYPSLAEVVVREDAVSLKRLQTSVFAEVLEARIEGGAASNRRTCTMLQPRSSLAW
jgi:hypothetical protein